MTPDQNQTPGEDPKLASLETRLDAARTAEAKRTATPQAPMGMSSANMRTGQRVVSMMVGYPLGGIVIGLLLDNYVFHTLPWITIGLMFLAFAGACRQVFSISKEQSE